MSATAAGAEGGGASSEANVESENSMYECNICLDTARDAVVSMCGHLFWYGNWNCIISDNDTFSHIRISRLTDVMYHCTWVPVLLCTIS